MRICASCGLAPSWRQRSALIPKQLFNLAEELWEVVLDNVCYEGPISSFVVVGKSMSKSGDSRPLNVRMGVFERSGEAVNLLPNVIERSCDNPLVLDVA